MSSLGVKDELTLSLYLSFSCSQCVEPVQSMSVAPYLHHTHTVSQVVMWVRLAGGQISSRLSAASPETTSFFAPSSTHITLPSDGLPTWLMPLGVHRDDQMVAMTTEGNLR